MLIYRADSLSSLYGVTIPSVVIMSNAPIGYTPAMVGYKADDYIQRVNIFGYMTISIVATLVLLVILQQDLVISKLLRQDIEKYKSLFPHVSGAIQLLSSKGGGKCPTKGGTI